MDTTETGTKALASDVEPGLTLGLDRQTVTRTRRGVAALAAVILVAVGIAVWAPWSTHNDDAFQQAVRARDGATNAATTALVTLNTIDPARPEETVDAWLRVAGGALESKLQSSRAQAVKSMRRGPAAEATVLETAVASLNATAGEATVLGVVEIRSTPRKGEPTTAVSRFRVLVQRLGTEWRITYLETVRTAP